MSNYNNSFVFYGSFYDAVKHLPKETQLNYLDKLLCYMTYGEEPVFSEHEKIELAMFSLVKPQIDKNSEKRNKGEAGGRPEITQEIKEAIIQDLQDGLTQKEVAEKYEIAQSTVAGIKKRYFDAQNYQKPDYHDDYHDNPEVYDNSQYHKPNANDNANDNDNDISPETSGGEDDSSFSKPQPTHNPEPAVLPERPQYTADSVPAEPPETPHAIPDSIFPVAAGCTDTAASPPKEKPKPKKPPLREREPVNDFEIVEKTYLHHWDTLYEAGVVHTADPVINWQQARKLLQGHFKTIPPDVIAQAIKTAAHDSFILEGGYSLTTILSSSVLNRLINAHYKPQEQKQTHYRRSAVIESDTMQQEDYL